MTRILSAWRTLSLDARRFLTGTILLELGHAFLWALQNLYMRAVGFGEADAGLVLSAGGVGVVAATIPSAWAYERLGARRSLTLAALGFGLALGALACATSLPLLVTFSFLHGASFTLHRVVSAPFLITACRPEERTRLFGAEFAAHTAASAVGTVAAGGLAGGLEIGALSEVSALRVALLLGGLLSLLSVTRYRLLGATPPRAAGSARAARRLRLERGAGVRRMFRVLAPRRWHLWWQLALPHALVGLGAGLTIPFINLYFTDRFRLPKEVLGLVMASSQVAMTVALFVLPRIVRRLGLLPATVLTELLSIPFFLTLAFTTRFEVALGAFVLRTALMNLAHPLWRQLIMELSPVRWRAAVNGVTMLAWNLGWATSNQLGGRLIESSAGWVPGSTDGYALPMLVTSGAYLLAIGCEGLFFWRVRHVGRFPRPAPQGSPPA